MPAIQTHELSKRYGDVTAVDRVDLTVEEGEIFGFLGHNGAGKSTVINMLLDFARPTEGQVEVFGMDCREHSVDVRERMGVLPEGYDVYDRLTGRQHLQFAAESKGVEIEPMSIAERVGIRDAVDRRAGDYSKGMAQRLVLGMALIGDPDLLILDEPTAGVDVQLRHDLWEIINRMNDAGTTILLTTHYIEEAERLCDRVAIVDDGRKVEVATPDELMARGTDTVEIELEATPATAPTLSVEGARDARIEGDQLLVSAAGGSSLAPAIMRDLEASGHTVTSLDVRRASLEEVFVDMTRADHGGDTEVEMEVDA